jgi:hypothetical protein
MVAPWTELSGHEAPACLLEPLFGSELRGLGPVPDLPKSGVFSPDIPSDSCPSSWAMAY